MPALEAPLPGVGACAAWGAGSAERTAGMVTLGATLEGARDSDTGGTGRPLGWLLWCLVRVGSFNQRASPNSPRW